MSDKEILKTHLLDSARSLFMEAGIAGLSVRRVAELAGTTTMAVYSRFGGKEGILTALFDEGFDKLSHAQNQVPSQLSPSERLRELCLIYRQVAQTYPQHYALMLGHFSGAFEPPEASRRKAMQTLETLITAVGACAPEQKPELIKMLSHQIWAFCHGWVSLEDKLLWGSPEESLQAYTAGIENFLFGAGLLSKNAQQKPPFFKGGQTEEYN